MLLQRLKLEALTAFVDDVIVSNFCSMLEVYINCFQSCLPFLLGTDAEFKQIFNPRLKLYVIVHEGSVVITAHSYTGAMCGY